MPDFLSQPWPWYVAGPLIGLVVPVLLIVGNRAFGVSSNFRYICAAVAPCGLDFFRIDWRRTGGWNLAFLAGVLAGGFIGGWVLGGGAGGSPVEISSRTQADLVALGIRDFSQLAPRDLFSWSALATLPGFVAVVVGGFLVGFGTAYAGGCTSGHAITGLADFQIGSLLAVLGFFAGGLLTTFVIWPLVL
jgi:uncharacterized membrane protein YedE/YeeE